MKTLKNQRTLAKKTRGQGMTEYIIITALVAIAAIGVITTFGDTIRRLFGSANDALSGVTSMAYTMSTAGAKASGKKGLSGFGSDNGTSY